MGACTASPALLAMPPKAVAALKLWVRTRHILASVAYFIMLTWHYQFCAGITCFCAPWICCHCCYNLKELVVPSRGYHFRPL